jgi:hypothetical protein
VNFGVFRLCGRFSQVESSSPSEEVEGGFHRFDDIGGKAVAGFAAGLSCVFDDVVFAFEAAVDEPCQGIEKAEWVQRAGLHGVFEAFGAEIDDGLADLGDGDFGRGLVAGEAFGAAGEVECEFVAEFAIGDALLVSEPVAVAAEFFPGGNMMRGEGEEIFDFRDQAGPAILIFDLGRIVLRVG